MVLNMVFICCLCSFDLAATRLMIAFSSVPKIITLGSQANAKYHDLEEMTTEHHVSVVWYDR